MLPTIPSVNYYRSNSTSTRAVRCDLYGKPSRASVTFLSTWLTYLGQLHCQFIVMTMILYQRIWSSSPVGTWRDPT